MLIPIPTKEETHKPVQPVRTDAEKDRWRAWYCNCPNWKCEHCGTTMFGRCMWCVYCKIKLNKHTPRPSSYVEPPPYESAV